MKQCDTLTDHFQYAEYKEICLVKMIELHMKSKQENLNRTNLLVTAP